jgi:hypothetical protein
MIIDKTEVILLDGDDLGNCTEAQADAYKLVLSLEKTGIVSCSAKFLSTELGLQSPAPLWYRLKHLEEHGKIQMSEAAIAV